MCWDVTAVICSLAECVNGAAREAGAAAEVKLHASRRNTQTLTAVIFSSRLQLKPSVFLILLPIACCGRLLKEIDYKISLNTGSLGRSVSYTSAFK